MIKKDDIVAANKSADIGKTPRVSGSTYVPQEHPPFGMGDSRREYYW